MFAVMLTGVAMSIGQTGLVLSLEAVVPDFKRINPKQGLQRLFSARSVWETVKQLLKITIVVAIAWPRVWASSTSSSGTGVSHSAMRCPPPVRASWGSPARSPGPSSSCRSPTTATSGTSTSATCG